MATLSRRKRPMSVQRGKPRVRAIRKVGFFGCNNKVVRVERRPPYPLRYPQVIRLQCPACTHEHDAQPMWRTYNKALDRDKEAVFV